MKLIVAMTDTGAGERVLTAMRNQGLPAVLVWSEAGPISGGQATLLIGAHDHDAADVCAAVASMTAVTQPKSQSLLPLTDPSDLHLGRQPLPGLSQTALFVLRVSRFEQIW